MSTRMSTALCLSALALSISGCMGTTDSVGGASEGLELPSTHRELPASVWELAPAGCEGRLGLGQVELVGASGAPDLRGIVSGNDVVCVDTVEAIGVEISALGRLNIVTDVISDTHLVFSAAHLYAHREEVAGDPSPQPDCPPDVYGGPQSMGNGSGLASGDPSPQPDSEHPTSADPSPQPDQPEGSSGQGSLGFFGVFGDLGI